MDALRDILLLNQERIDNLIGTLNTIMETVDKR